MNEIFLLISWMCVPLVYAAGKNTVMSFTGKAKSLQKNIFKLKSQIQGHTFCWSTKVLFFFLIHRAAPNTQSFHQIRKKNWTTFQLWFAKMDTYSQSCVLSRKGTYLETWCPANLWECQIDCYMPSCLNPLLKNAWHVLLPPLYSL